MAYMRILREFPRLWPALRDTLPLACLLCNARTQGGLCPHCRARLLPNTPRCPRCSVNSVVNRGQTPISRNGGLTPINVTPVISCPITSCPDCVGLSPCLLRVVAVFDYEWPGDLLIQALKHGGRFAGAPVLAGLLAQRCQDLNLTPRHGCLVTPVPASRHALIRRGYNPAAELGRYLARRLGLPWQPGLLVRNEQGEQQKHLTRAERRRHVQGLYACRGDVRGKQILVVDDVMTTGSTLSGIADALHAQGAAAVYGAVVARTPLRGGAARP